MSHSNSKSFRGALRLAFSGWGLSWKGLIRNENGEWWLIGQLLILAAHLLPALPSPISIGINWPKILTFIGLTVLLVGIFLAVRAFFRLGPSLSPLPDPKPGAKLVTTGAYQHCRHPLYQALIISSIAITISIGSLLHLVLLISLCILLRGKAKREERLLKKIHPEYSSYQINTPALIPGCPMLDWRS